MHSIVITMLKGLLLYPISPEPISTERKRKKENNNNKFKKRGGPTPPQFKNLHLLLGYFILGGIPVPKHLSLSHFFF